MYFISLVSIICVFSLMLTIVDDRHNREKENTELYIQCLKEWYKEPCDRYVLNRDIIEIFNYDEE